MDKENNLLPNSNSFVPQQNLTQEITTLSNTQLFQDNSENQSYYNNLSTVLSYLPNQQNLNNSASYIPPPLQPSVQADLLTRITATLKKLRKYNLSSSISKPTASINQKILSPSAKDILKNNNNTSSTNIGKQDDSSSGKKSSNKSTPDNNPSFSTEPNTDQIENAITNADKELTELVEDLASFNQSFSSNIKQDDLISETRLTEQLEDQKNFIQNYSSQNYFSLKNQYESLNSQNIINSQNSLNTQKNFIQLNTDDSQVFHNANLTSKNQNIQNKTIDLDEKLNLAENIKKKLIENSSSFSIYDTNNNNSRLGATCSSHLYIDRILEENQQMIYSLHENINIGKLTTLHPLFARLQQNLIYLALLADQPSQSYDNTPLCPISEDFNSDLDFWSEEEINALHNTLRQSKPDLKQLHNAVKTKSETQILDLLKRYVARHEIKMKTSPEYAAEYPS